MKMFFKRVIFLAAVLLAAPWYLSASVATEIHIGKPRTVNGMEIAASYIQAVETDTAGGHHGMQPRKDSDVHLEAHINAAELNPLGFPEGAWVPYLSVEYTVIKDGSGELVEGTLMPMVASDGPHYGDNVKLHGVGKYRLVLKVRSSPDASFVRHTDKETGVSDWFEPFTVSFDFAYYGSGKKGGY